MKAKVFNVWEDVLVSLYAVHPLFWPAASQINGNKRVWGRFLDYISSV